MTGDFLPDRNPSLSGGEGAIGRKRLNTWEGGPLGDDNQGTLSSPAFEITATTSTSCGGGPPERRVTPSRARDRRSGRQDRDRFERRHPQLEELGRQCLPGQEAVIESRTRATGGWGHLTFDHLVLGPTAALPRSVETTVNLVVDGQIVRTATGSNSETLDWVNWDVRDLEGERARIQIIDNNTGGGDMLADHFTFANASGPVGDPAGALVGLRPGLLRRSDVQQRAEEPADHDRLDEQLAVRRQHPDRPMAQCDERAPGPGPADRRR